MKRRTVYTLSVLLLVVLLCALLPAAYAEDCVCASAPERDPACTGGCGTALELMRKSALSDFLMITMAAESENDPEEQATLYREAVKCWDSYMDIVLQSLGTALAVKDEMPTDETMGIIGGADGPTDIYLTPEADGKTRVPDDPETAAAPVFSMPAGKDTYSEEQKNPEVMLLADYLLYMFAAEEEQDPVIQQQLRDKADQAWSEYLDLLLSELTDGRTEQHRKQSPRNRSDDHGPLMAESASDAACEAQNSQKTDDVYLTEPAFGSASTPIVSESFGMPNPWTQTDSFDEAAEVSGVVLHLPGEADLPKGMKLLYYRAVPGTLEADYSDENEDLMIRASLDEEGYILSGDYNTYTREWKEDCGGVTVDCLGDGARVNVAMFEDGDMAYAVTMACGREGAGLTANELGMLVAAILSAPETPAAAEGVDIYADPVDIYADPKPVTILSEMAKPEVEKNGEIMILYTGDVRCGIDEGFGYAGLKALRDSLEAKGYTTVLVDGGDAVQGAEIGSQSRGEAIIDLMNALDYDVAIPGDQDTDYGDEQFLRLVRAADFPYISCNFTIEGELALEPYVILDADGKRIAFIGVTAEKDKETAIALLQRAVDSARYEGAEIVYVIGHTDAELQASELVAATTGVDVFFDNYCGGEPVILSDKAGEDVILVSCGEKLSGIGYSRINASGYVVENGVWSWPNSTSAAMLLGVENDVAEMVESANQKLAEMNSEAADTEDDTELSFTDKDMAMLDELLAYYR